MRLDLFDIMDEACEILHASQDDFMEAEVRIIQCLKSLLVHSEDSILEMSSRIKTATSLREKIVRNKLYHNLESGSEVISSLHDLIGVTIKCQFIREEKRLYEMIQAAFQEQNEAGFYYNEKFPNIVLDLDMPQPQYQKNGNTVYRIDGHCVIGKKKINFELQIKAIVFTFWSEIEHKIVYKNNNYSLNNEFISQLLSSIRISLVSIDQQLNIIYNEMQTRNTNLRLTDESSIKQVIAKSINDTFITKIQESIGFTVNFKNECDLLSEFLIQQQSERNQRKLFIEIIDQLNKIKDKAIDFEHPIMFDDEIVSDDRFTQIIASAFLWYMNSDFEWFLFFKMMFELMDGTNNNDFMKFLTSYRSRFVQPALYRPIQRRFTASQADEIVSEILATIALSLIDIGSISILHEPRLERLVEVVSKFVENLVQEISDYSFWMKYQSNMMNELSSQLKMMFLQE